MPGNIRALIVVLGIGFVVLPFARMTFARLMTKQEFWGRSATWLLITLCAFLSPNFWVFMALAGCVLLYAYRKESNPVALYFFVLFAAPVFAGRIPGFGVVNYVFDVDYLRLLSLTILLPACVSVIFRKDTLPFGKMASDLFVLGFIVVTIVLQLRGTTVTDTARHAFYAGIDILLPYYVISRSLKDLRSINEAVAALTVAVLLLSAVLIFSTLKEWHLYSVLGHSWDLNEHFRYKYRLDLLRAVGTTGGPIMAGYVVMVGLALFYYLRPYMRIQSLKSLFFAALAAGLIAPFSRGPWIGLAVFFATYFALGRNALIDLMQMGFVLVVVALVGMLTAPGAAIVDMLPYVGGSEQSSVDYRELLWTTSLDVMRDNFWLGTVAFETLPKMQVLKEGGGGIVDVVNTYLQIGLEYGVVGLTLFLGFWVSVVFAVFRALPQTSANSYHVLGRTLLALCLATLVTIFTVSSGTVIALMYWSLAGLAVAYARMAKQEYMESTRVIAEGGVGTLPNHAAPVVGVTCGQGYPGRQ